jgi:DNA-binding NtrC family response regulator
MKPRILVVDDEQAFAESLAERLELRGYDATTVFNGTDAVAKVSEANYDVVILDVFMPDKGGLEVLKEIKAIKPLTEVVMLSGHSEVETAIEGMRAGAYHFLLKPAESDDLLSKIDEAHQRKAQQEQRIRDAKVQDYVESPRSALKD